jgi:hypothetical protein
MIIHDNFQFHPPCSIGEFNIATLWEICKTNFFSRTTGWIGTILGRNVPDFNGRSLVITEKTPRIPFK